MPNFLRLSILVLFFQGFYTFAQPNKMITNKDNYNWMFGASWMLLDDDGIETNPFNFDQYHSAVFPTRFFADKYIYNGWSFQAGLGFQKYDSTRIVNDSIGINGRLIAIDADLKYSFYKTLGRNLIDPYIFVGGGITTREIEARNTAKAMSVNGNVGAGVNLWVSNNIGIQLQSVAKFSLTDLKGTSSYMAHTAGVVVRLEKSNGGGTGEFSKSKYKVKKSRTKIKVPKGGKKQKES